MRWQGILREAWRNTIGGTARTVQLALLLLVASTLLAGADVALVRDADTRARDFQASGASVSVLDAQGQVDPVLCGRLNTLPNVRAAGALRRVPSLVPISLPRSSLPAFEVTPQMLSILLPELDGAAPGGVYLSADAAAALGVRVGDRARFTSGQAVVRGIYAYPDDGRLRTFGYAALLPTADTDAFDSCWVDEWPQTSLTNQQLRNTIVPGSDEASTSSPQLSQLNATHGPSLDARALFLGRITRSSAPIAFLVGLFAGLAAIALRRLELASARHVGVRRFDLVAIVAVETAWWVLPTLVAGAVVGGLSAVAAAPGDRWVYWALAASTAIAATVGALLGTLTATAALDESHLYGYFKAR